MNDDPYFQANLRFRAMKFREEAAEKILVAEQLEARAVSVGSASMQETQAALPFTTEEPSHWDELSAVTQPMIS